MSPLGKRKVKGVKDRKLVEHGVPVQAYVPREVYVRFKDRFPQRGAISKLIRKAFLLALEEKDAAPISRQARHHLPPALVKDKCRCDETNFLGECPLHPNARKVVATVNG